MLKDRRVTYRVEPAFLDAILDFRNKRMRGRVLDSSSGGMAVALVDDIDCTSGLQEDVQVSVTEADCNSAEYRVGPAKVMRKWNSAEMADYSTELLDIGKGVALRFESQIESKTAEKYLLLGTQQRIRSSQQVELALRDIDYLGEYRRDLINCQTKIFVLTLTVGVALAGAYFGLSYHNATANFSRITDLRFWRTMMAALPGCLSIVCALMVAQKSISIQKVDAFLMLLKKYYTMKQFPREYQGWEEAYRKFRYALNSKACLACGCRRKCGVLKEPVLTRLKARGLMSSPAVDFYYIIIYATFFVILGLSLAALILEISTAKWDSEIYMAISSFLTFVIIFVAGYIVSIFLNLRKGRYSFETNRRSWIDILNRCRLPV